MEKFILEINAYSEDGENIKSEIKASVSCSSEMAIGVLVNLMNNDENLKKIIVNAVTALVLDDDSYIEVNTKKTDLNNNNNDITL